LVVPTSPVKQNEVIYTQLQGAKEMQTKILWVLFFLVSTMTACGGMSKPTEPLVTPPAISVQITKEYCPSIEVQAGMQIAWTNRDDVDRMLWIEYKDGQGVLVDAGGTDLLQPETTFSITLTNPGEYTYYCSKDRKAFGTITVLR
jgi:plastocyanin